mmetsp:Transcript_7361/g.10874  ORF Transcript_7361/g.10874 Transcript_7361/m.10874 type:complete len:317 (-) Transcript_7361:347-1297(-)
MIFWRFLEAVSKTLRRSLLISALACCNSSILDALFSILFLFCSLKDSKLALTCLRLFMTSFLFCSSFWTFWMTSWCFCSWTDLTLCCSLLHFSSCSSTLLWNSCCLVINLFLTCFCFSSKASLLVLMLSSLSLMISSNLFSARVCVLSRSFLCSLIFSFSFCFSCSISLSLLSNLDLFSRILCSFSSSSFLRFSSVVLSFSLVLVSSSLRLAAISLILWILNCFFWLRTLKFSWAFNDLYFSRLFLTETCLSSMVFSLVWTSSLVSLSCCSLSLRAFRRFWCLNWSFCWAMFSLSLAFWRSSCSFFFFHSASSASF